MYEYPLIPQLLHDDCDDGVGVLVGVFVGVVVTVDVTVGVGVWVLVGVVVVVGVGVGVGHTILNFDKQSGQSSILVKVALLNWRLVFVSEITTTQPEYPLVSK